MVQRSDKSRTKDCFTYELLPRANRHGDILRLQSCSFYNGSNHLVVTYLSTQQLVFTFNRGRGKLSKQHRTEHWFFRVHFRQMHISGCSIDSIY